MTTVPGSYLVVYYSVLLNRISCFLDCFKYVNDTRIAVFIYLFLITRNNKTSVPCCPATHLAICFDQMLNMC